MAVHFPLAQSMFMEHNMKITIKNVNVETGEETIFERDETDQEKTERLATEKAYKDFKAELETKATAKAALLSKLGITAEEAQLLLS